MTLRTVQINGMGFGSSPAEISVTLDGNVVFSGTVTTQDNLPWAMPDLDLINQEVVLCSFTVPMETAGEVPMVCTVNNGTVIFGTITANYSTIPNPVFTTEDLAILNSTDPSVTLADKVAVVASRAVPAFTTEELALLNSVDPSVAAEQAALLASHGVSLKVSSGATGFVSTVSTDSRNDVVINGVPTTPDHGDLPGTWWWTINSGSNLAYNLEITAGNE
jgi:hypothetical protein